MSRGIAERDNFCGRYKGKRIRTRRKKKISKRMRWNVKLNV